MSRQLAISSAVSVMIMAIFVLYGPGLAQHGDSLSQATMHLPQLTGSKTLLAM